MQQPGTKELHSQPRGGPLFATRPSTEERLQEVESVVAFDGDDEVNQGRTSLVLEAVPAAGPRYTDVRSVLPRAVPFLPEPGYRTFAANVPGDSGFDPIALCTDVSKFVFYREAELKHGRLAMLAAVAWPLAEFTDQAAYDAGAPNLLADTGGRLLPQLTGGLEDQFVEFFLSLVILVGAIFELNTKAKEASPGNFGFDPLGLKEFEPPAGLQGFLPPQRQWMAEAEVKHSRLAMVTVLYDIVDELFTGNPVVEDTEYFFHRIDAKFFRWEYWALQPEALDFPPMLDSAL